SLGLGDAHLTDAELIGDQHLDAHTVALDDFAGLGHAAEPFADQASDGRGLDILFAMKARDEIGQPVDVEAAGDNEAAATVFFDVAFGLVFIANLSDDHFQEIFHGGEARGVAIFIHHDDHMAVLLLHLAHQVGDRLSFGHEHDGADELAHGAPRALALIELEHVAHVNKSDDLVDGLLVDRDAGELLVNDNLAKLLELRIGRYSNDRGPRRHHFANDLVAELHHALDELAVFLFDQAL